jgi:thioredoxin-related protein
MGREPQCDGHLAGVQCTLWPATSRGLPKEEFQSSDTIETMKAKHVVVFILLSSVVSFAQWKKTPLQEPAEKNARLYPANADAIAEISKATATASKDHKRVLLVFGGNWCSDCHVLDRAFHLPRIAPLLNGNFEVVHVDVGKYDKNLDLAKKYHVDLEKGVPEVAVLNGDGTFVYSTAEFEKARLLSEEDVLDFLNKWKPQSASVKN